MPAFTGNVSSSYRMTQKRGPRDFNHLVLQLAAMIKFWSRNRNGYLFFPSARVTLGMCCVGQCAVNPFCAHLLESHTLAPRHMKARSCVRTALFYTLQARLQKPWSCVLLSMFGNTVGHV